MKSCKSNEKMNNKTLSFHFFTNKSTILMLILFCFFMWFARFWNLNLNMWTAKDLAQASYTELTLPMMTIDCRITIKISPRPITFHFHDFFIEHFLGSDLFLFSRLFLLLSAYQLLRFRSLSSRSTVIWWWKYIL